MELFYKTYDIMEKNSSENLFERIHVIEFPIDF